MTHQGIMAGKRGLIVGLANHHSLAWGIAQALHAQGATLAFTYQNEALQKRVEPLGRTLGCDIFLPCDVSSEAQMADVFKHLEEAWGGIDFVLHAVGFSNKDELKGLYMNTSHENFINTMDVSCYSFTRMCRLAAPLMNEGGSLLTLSYLGAERVMPHYNVMGVAKAALEASVRYLACDLGPQNVRVNALSAGPAKTLAASGIGDFRTILKWNQDNAPLRRNVTLEDVGSAAMYLLSPLSAAVTGETHHVDCGYHIVGMKAIDSPEVTIPE